MKSRLQVVLLFLMMSFLFLFSYSCTPQAGPATDTSNDDTEQQNDGKKSGDYVLIYYDVEQGQRVEQNMTMPDGQEKTPEFFISQTARAMQSSIGYNGAVLEGDRITVDFLKDYPPVSSGSSGESALLDSIAETLLANFPEVKEIHYTCEGNAYESGHLYFEVDEAYKVRETQ